MATNSNRICMCLNFALTSELYALYLEMHMKVGAFVEVY
jgi:hypothetical protein